MRTFLIADIDFQKLNFAKITAHSVERWNRKFSNAANASTTRAENTLDQAKIVPLLTAALQQALQRIEVLEQKINN